MSHPNPAQTYDDPLPSKMKPLCRCVATCPDCECYCCTPPKLDIKFCPFHASTPKLLKAMKEATELLREGDGSERLLTANEVLAITTLDLAIAQAEGK